MVSEASVTYIVKIRNNICVFIDEVDSILIDEAQNPLIISRGSRQGGIIHPSEYQSTTQLANTLQEKKDYIVDEKEKEL